MIEIFNHYEIFQYKKEDYFKFVVIKYCITISTHDEKSLSD